MLRRNWHKRTILSWVQAEGEKEGGKEMEEEKRRGREVQGQEKGKGETERYRKNSFFHAI